MADFGSIIKQIERPAEKDREGRAGPGSPGPGHQGQRSVGCLSRLAKRWRRAAPGSCRPRGLAGKSSAARKRRTSRIAARWATTANTIARARIAPNVVVTAKHCEWLTRVYLRGTDVTKPDNAEIIPIAEEFVHPELDLRILVLKHNAVTPPRTVAHASQLVGIEDVTLVGFGRIDPNGTIGFGTKRRVNVPVMTFDCGQMDEPKRYGCLPGREIVAGHAGLLLDSCKGDSGGPLYIQRDGEFYLLGATSATRGAHPASVATAASTSAWTFAWIGFAK